MATRIPVVSEVALITITDSDREEIPEASDRATREASDKVIPEVSEEIPIPEVSDREVRVDSVILHHNIILSQDTTTVASDLWIPVAVSEAEAALTVEAVASEADQAAVAA